MSNKTTLSIPCPTCQELVLMTDAFPHRPFCSERCKLIDFGEWAAENRKIPDTGLEDEGDEWSEDPTL